jgi:hypothetical protein
MRALLLVVISACSFTEGQAPRDAGIDGMIVIDGSVSARAAREIVAGAGRAKVGTITIDIEVGHGIAVKKSMAGTHTIEGAPVVKP